jgi:hypothetical protein
MAYKKSPKGTPRNTFVQKYKKYVPRPRKVIKTTATLASLARDVMIMKGLTSSVMAGLNTEKKYQDKDVFTGAFGQANGNANGIFMMDVTPAMPQGIGSAQRIGNSIKLTGLSFPVQFSGQSHTFTSRKIKMMLFRVSSANNGVTLTDTISDYFDVNPLNGIIDYNSPKAYRSHKHDGIKLIRQKVYSLPAVPTTIVGNDDEVSAEERSGFSTKFNVKLDDILRFNEDGHSFPDGTRYYMFFLADKGTVTNASTLDIPIPSIDTGVQFRLSQRSWWVDN